jgi:membrane associated rhomboid family serine protease
MVERVVTWAAFGLVCFAFGCMAVNAVAASVVEVLPRLARTAAPIIGASAEVFALTRARERFVAA